MSNAPIRKKRKAESATGQHSQVGGDKVSDTLKAALQAALHDIIRRSVMGKCTLWPIHNKLKRPGSWEDMFNAGDKQALLWAIDECAQTVTDERFEAQPIPKWAAEAIIDKIYRGVTRVCYLG